MTHPSLAVLALLLLPLPQEPTKPTTPAAQLRARLVGSVRHVDGKPWVGVKVFLHALPYSKLPRLAAGDLVETVTDKRGRFHARLLAGRPYCAWAVGPVDEHGWYRSTEIVSKVFAGAPVRLEEAEAELMRVRVRVEGRERWADQGPLACFVRSAGAMPLVLPLELDANGEAELPVLPGTSCRVRVESATGYPILDANVRLGAKARTHLFESQKQRYAKFLEAKKAQDQAKASAAAKPGEQAEQKPAAGKAAGNEQATTKPAATKPAEKKQADKKPADKKPADKKQANAAAKKQPQVKAKAAVQLAVVGRIFQVANVALGRVAVGVEPRPGNGPVLPPLPPNVQRIMLVDHPRMLVKVVSPEGKPAPGVELSELWSDARKLGVTDASGFCKVPLDASRLRSSFYPMQIAVRSDEFAEARYQPLLIKKGGQNPFGANFGAQLVEIDPKRDFAKVVAAGKPDYTIKLARGIALSGRVLLGDGIPAADTPILWFSDLKLGAVNNITFGGPNGLTARVFRTDHEGRFRLPGRQKGMRYRLAALLDVDQIVRLPEDKRFGLTPLTWICAGATPDKDADLGDLRLDQLEVLELEIRSPGGSPANRPRVLVHMGENRNLSNLNEFDELAADRRGRVRMLVPKGMGAEVLIVADNAEGKQVSVPADRPAGPVRIVLDPATLIQGKVVNGKGEPVAGARIQFSFLHFGGRRDLLASLIQTTGKAGEDGSFRIPVRRPGVYNFYAHVRIAGKSYQAQSQTMQINEDAPAIELVIPGAPGPKERAKLEAEADKKSKQDEAPAAAAGAIRVRR